MKQEQITNKPANDENEQQTKQTMKREQITNKTKTT